MDQYELLIIVILLAIIGSLIIWFIGPVLRSTPKDTRILKKGTPMELDIADSEMPGKIFPASNSTEFEKSYQLLLEKIKNFKARNSHYLNDEFSNTQREY